MLFDQLSSYTGTAAIAYRFRKGINPHLKKINEETS